MESPKKLKLYGYWRSSASWRVRIVLNLKNIDYEYSPIHLLKDGGQQKSAEYEKINPMKHVPALEVDGNIIVESMAICEYLDEAHPEVRLLPKDPIKKAQVRAFCEMINSGIQPLCNLKVLQKLEEKQVDKNEWLQHWLSKGLESLNKFAEGKTTTYILGDELTLADVFLTSIMGAAARFNVNTTEFKNLLRASESTKSNAAFEKALPKNQPDAEA